MHQEQNWTQTQNMYGIYNISQKLSRNQSKKEFEIA